MSNRNPTLPERLEGGPFNVVEIVERDDFDDSDYESMDLGAKLLHAKQNGKNDEPNRHAVLLGDSVVVVERNEER